MNIGKIKAEGLSRVFTTTYANLGYCNVFLVYAGTMESVENASRYFVGNLYIAHPYKFKKICR